MADIVVSLEKVKNRMSSVLLGKINNYRKNLRYLSEAGALSDPSYIVDDRRMSVLRLSEKTDLLAGKILDRSRAKLVGAASKLEALSPLAVVARGYGVVSDSQGTAVKSVSKLCVGEVIDIRLADGHASATVNSISEEK
jgi:exodeoxyribonuclease VII large subunit